MNFFNNLNEFKNQFYHVLKVEKRKLIFLNVIGLLYSRSLKNIAIVVFFINLII